MNLHHLIIATAVTATVCAGQTSSLASSAVDKSAYIGLSAVSNNFSGDLDAEGFRLDSGFDIGNGLSIDGRFENAYTDAVSPGQEWKFNDLRVLAHYTQELSEGVCLEGGFGYGKVGFSNGGVDLFTTEGLLADVGVSYQSGRLSAGLSYTHLFALYVGTFTFGSSPAIEKEDIGILEASLGYEINDNVTAIFSLQTQVLGDTEFEKDLGAAMGLRYNF
jgi:hypothetical protein